ncbi:MAG TPA: 50S ribosomal protein L34 [Patescibacteria group bacterium]|nr:50S ribosomal protein L34 [Patescibacteria group bacterium]
MPELLKKSSKTKHRRKHGFLGRLKTRTGKQVIKRRRLKGRKRV